jgi:lysophospholipase L1-like esterase
MKPSSKQWLYAGLAVVAGVGVVRLMSGPRIRRGLKVLLIGDSLAVGTAPHYAVLAKEAGVELKHLAVVGTRIDQWAGSQELPKILQSFAPDLVLVSLGTNDAFMQGDVIGKQRAQLEKLLGVLAGREIVWIGPPALPTAPSPGIVTMIQDAAGSALSPRFHYFHSERLQIPRGPDALHPTARGYAGWAGAVWHWLS